MAGAKNHDYHILPPSPWPLLSSLAALVLATHAEGGSGPLVTHFAAHAGQLPCPLYLVPGGLSREDIDRLA